MRLEILIQFIVPLTFLAIWALTSLLNRDAQPLPPRPGRPGGGPGAAPSLARGPGQAEARPPAAPLQPRPSVASPAPPPSQAASAWPGPGPPPSSRDRLGPRRPQNLDEAIVYIENGPGPRGGTRTGAGSQSSSRSSRTSPARRSFRGRSAASPPPAPQGRSEPETPRALSDMMSQSRALQKAKPLELTPLGAPIVGLTRTPVRLHGGARRQPASRRGQPPDAQRRRGPQPAGHAGQDPRGHPPERDPSASPGPPPRSPGVLKYRLSHPCRSSGLIPLRAFLRPEDRTFAGLHQVAEEARARADNLAGPQGPRARQRHGTARLAGWHLHGWSVSGSRTHTQSLQHVLARD